MYGFLRSVILLLQVLTARLVVDAVENFLCALVSRSLFHGRDDIVVVEVIGTEHIDMRTALVTLRCALVAIVAVAALLTLCLTLLLFCKAGGLLLGVPFQVS